MNRPGYTLRRYVQIPVNELDKWFDDLHKTGFSVDAMTKIKAATKISGDIAFVPECWI